MRRREFIVSVGAFAALPACGPAEGEPPVTPPPIEGPGPEPEERWEPAGALDTARFPFGVQVGDAGATEVTLSVHSDEPQLIVTLARGVEDGWFEEFALAPLDPVDGALQLRLQDLAPDHAYSVTVFAPGGERRSEVTRFRTAPAPGESRVLRFGATSCFGGNAPWRSLTQAARERLDFFILGGDTVYADNASNEQLRALWQSALGTQGLKDITASTSIIAAWDDHEVGNNWSWDQPGMDVRVPLAVAEFRRALPQLGGETLYRKLSWGAAADLIVLDSRGERLNGDYISSEQMAFVKQTLSESTARFKIVVNTVPITDLADLVGDIQAADRWQGFPVQRAELLNHIRDEAIEGVFWISGDFHLGAIGRVDPEGGVAADQWEVLAGPAGSPINVAANLVQPDPARYPAVLGSHNTVLFDADPDAGTIRVRFIGDAGGVIADETLEV